MFQRDYILRLLEQLAKTLGAVLTLKKANRFEEAELAIGEAAKNLVGLDVATLLALPVEQIVTLGHRLVDCVGLVEENKVDLLVLNTKDTDQLAMHGLAYPLAVEVRQIPLLML